MLQRVGMSVGLYLVVIIDGVLARKGELELACTDNSAMVDD